MLKKFGWLVAMVNPTLYDNWKGHSNSTNTYGLFTLCQVFFWALKIPK